MKRVQLLFCGAGLLMAGFSTGCTTDLGDFTLLASKNIDLEHFDSQSAEKTPEVTGVDTAWFSFSDANVKDACDIAEDQGHASALTNARITDFSIPIIEHQITITGNPIPK
jgi:hypothetical protein